MLAQGITLGTPDRGASPPVPLSRGCGCWPLAGLALQLVDQALGQREGQPQLRRRVHDQVLVRLGAELEEQVARAEGSHLRDDRTELGCGKLSRLARDG